MASYDTFLALKDFVKGKINKFELEGSDPSIEHVHNNESNLGQSVIKLNFDDDFFWKESGLSEDDVWFLRVMNSPYSDYEFMDSYSVYDDFKNGYIIFNELNEDNVEKLKIISRYIFPRKFDLDSEEFKSGFAEKLLNTFKRETKDIIDDYHTEKNREMTEVTRNKIKKELMDYFDNFGFTYLNEDQFKTTVANLIMWYIRENSIHVPIEKLLPKIIATGKNEIGGWHENSYENQDSEVFDGYSFNNYVERKLDEIIEKIEDGADGDFDLKDYLDMANRVSKKFESGKWYPLPKMKDVRFRIENFEMNPNKIVVDLSKGLKARQLKLTEENFYHLLYQPTIFNLEEI